MTNMRTLTVSTVSMRLTRMIAAAAVLLFASACRDLIVPD
jgi:hypothetical protein